MFLNNGNKLDTVVYAATFSSKGSKTTSSGYKSGSFSSSTSKSSTSKSSTSKSSSSSSGSYHSSSFSSTPKSSTSTSNGSSSYGSSSNSVNRSYIPIPIPFHFGSWFGAGGSGFHFGYMLGDIIKLFIIIAIIIIIRNKIIKNRRK